MKVLIAIFVCFLVIVGAVGGVTSELDLDDETLQQLLDDPELAALLDEPDEFLKLLKKKLVNDQCLVATDRTETIIRTKESQELGAVFISVPLVTNRRQCIEACCNSTQCNTAIIKEKDDEAGCYLFNCGNPNVCVFTENDGFSTVQFYPRHLMGKKVIHSNKIAAVTSTTTVTTTKISVSSLPTVSPGRLHNSCKSDWDCIGGYRVSCSGGVCVCRSGFHVVGNTCRKDCTPYEYECINKKHPENSECVPVYFRCDSHEHCSDGSDELNCAVNSTNEPVTRKNIANPAVPSSTTKSVASSHHTNPPSASLPQTHHSVLELNDSKSDDGRALDDEITLHAVTHEMMLSSAFKGAVVALTLGVAIIILLVIFTVCHLRLARSRSLKGRLRNSNEADYLINGMYL